MKEGIYISGPITGFEDYKETFAKAEEDLMKRFPGAKIFNPARIMEGFPYLDYEDCMTVCLTVLDNFCDTIYMLKYWEDSRGANRELGYALGQDKAVIYAE